MIRVLITDHLHPRLEEMLRQGGMQCDVQPDISNDELAECAGQYEGLVVATKIKVTEALLERAPSLRFVARAGSGMENIDRQAAARRGVHCLSSPEGNADAVAEHAVGMMLALLRHTVRADAQMRRGQFLREPNRGRELGAMTLGIIGFGHTGSALAGRLQGFGMRMLAYDKYKSGFGTSYCKESDLEQIYRHADVLSLHLPLSEETRYFLNAERMARFENPIYVINTSRGQVIHTLDLIQAMEEGRVLGAALDVFEQENLALFGESEMLWWKQLCAMEQVLLSPHVAGLTRESKFRIAEVLGKKILSLKLGPIP